MIDITLPILYGIGLGFAYVGVASLIYAMVRGMSKRRTRSKDAR